MSPPSSPLIDARTLAGELAGDRPPVVLDVRYTALTGPNRDAYREAHIPGAVFVDLDRELAGAVSTGTGRHPLPDLAVLQAFARSWGVTSDSPVVVYDEGPAMSASRAWWLLRWAGHADVRVLDGGLAAWVAAGGRTSTEAPEPDYGDVVLTGDAMPVVDIADVPVAAADGVLLDVRAGERYRGETEPIDPVAGHVPLAINAPAPGNLASDGRFLAPDALRERFAALGVGDNAPVTAMCGSGVVAAQTVLALEVAGIEAGLFVGSWSQWVSDPSRPIATGDS